MRLTKYAIIFFSSVLAGAVLGVVSGLILQDITFGIELGAGIAGGAFVVTSAANAAVDLRYSNRVQALPQQRYQAEGDGINQQQNFAGVFVDQQLPQPNQGEAIVNNEVVVPGNHQAPNPGPNPNLPPNILGALAMVIDPDHFEHYQS